MGREELANKVTAQTREFSRLSALSLKLALAIVSTPLIISFTISFKEGLSSLGRTYSQCFFYGIVAYIILHFFVYRPITLYRRGQLILRFLFGFFSPLVKVAPYLLPIYSILIISSFVILRSIFNINPDANTFLFFISFSLVLHLVISAEELRDKEVGLARANYFFGFASIYLVNILILSAGLHLMFAKFSFLEFLSRSGSKSLIIYQHILRQLFA